jgi:queuine/archaeosine tRNA-ribosyltransferase
LHFYLDLMSQARLAIEHGYFAAFRAQFAGNYQAGAGLNN